MVSLQSSPAPGARWGRTSISGANTRTSSCGRSRLIGQEQSWSSVWGEPARADRALLGPHGPPRAAFGVSAACSGHDRSRRSAAAVGQHPSLSGAPRERCPLAPRNAAYRAAGPLGCAGRSATRLLAARPPPPASLPRLPGLADGQGSWRGPDPAIFGPFYGCPRPGPLWMKLVRCRQGRHAGGSPKPKSRV